ncbi:MAG: hypothetical protein BGO70_02765 [Bacteroidetes bacterium 43-93]|nr:hypothetical protein [Bacteroidota bacterium]OJX00708.1 MAG: hypothetical protein BGO70_02765 [Bacteroidetes bacterium 43-93]
MKIFQSITKYFLLARIKRVIVIDIIEHKTAEGKQLKVNMIIVSRNKNELKIEQKQTFSSIAELLRWFDNKPVEPIFLTLNGDRVVHVIKDVADAKNKEDIFNDVVPNTNISDFIIQEYALLSNRISYSITRKSNVDDILRLLHPIAKHIVDIQFGPFAVIDVYPALFKPKVNGKYHIEFAQCSIVIENELLLECDVRNYLRNDSVDTFSYNNQIISIDFQVCLARSLDFFLSTKIGNRVNIPPVEMQKDEFIFSLMLKPVVTIFLGILLVMLTISTVCFNIYSEKSAESNNQWEYLSSKISQNAYKQKKQIDEENFANVNGLLTAGNVSFFADQITRTLPDDIYINRLMIYPILSQNESNLNVFDTSKILIYGNCYSSEDVAGWVGVLKSYKWVKNITLKQFQQINENELGNFCIEINKENI